jgi:hypothetical protein
MPAPTVHLVLSTCGTGSVRIGEASVRLPGSIDLPAGVLDAEWRIDGHEPWRQRATVTADALLCAVPELGGWEVYGSAADCREACLR